MNQELRPCPFKLKKMIYDKECDENNSAHRWMNSFNHKAFKMKRILPSWHIRAFMFWYLDTFDFSTRNISHCRRKILSSLEMKERKKEWICEFSIFFAPIWRFVYHAISMIHDGRGDIFLSALATQGFWSMKRAFVIEESFILHAT